MVRLAKPRLSAAELQANRGNHNTRVGARENGVAVVDEGKDGGVGAGRDAAEERLEEGGRPGLPGHAGVGPPEPVGGLEHLLKETPCLNR